MQFELKSVRGGWLLQSGAESRLYLHLGGAVSQALHEAQQARCIVTVPWNGGTRVIYDSDRDAAPHRYK